MKKRRNRQQAAGSEIQTTDASASNPYEEGDALNAQFIADGKLVRDADGELEFVDAAASQAYHECQRHLQNRHIADDTRLIPDTVLQECIARQDGQGVLDRLQYLTSRRKSVRAQWSRSYFDVCHAASSITLRIAMVGFAEQLERQIQIDPLGVLHQIFSSPPQP